MASLVSGPASPQQRSKPLALAVGLVVLLTVHSAAHGALRPAVVWTPGVLEHTVGAGESAVFHVSFVSSATVQGATLWIVPGLQDFLRAEPSRFATIPAATPQPLRLTVSVPHDTVPGVYEGTLHLVVGSQTRPAILTIRLRVVPAGNHAPVANAGPDQTAFVTETIFLDGTASTDVDGDTLSFSWSILSHPAGSAATLSDPHAVRPTFAVDVPGRYVVQLVVNDGVVDSTPDTVTISTQNSRPVADAGPAQTVAVGDTVMLDGRQSLDVDGDALTYAWRLVDVPDGSRATLDDGEAPTPTFVVDLAGTYLAELVVSDGVQESLPTSVRITTHNSRPLADAGPDITAREGDAVMLDGRASRDADGDPLTYQWVLIVVPAGSQAGLVADATATPTLLVDSPGEYVAQLIVNDGSRDSVPDTVVITATLPVTTVPDVIGMTEALAEAAIAGSHLTVRSIARANSSVVPAGRVISQHPTAGTLVLETSPVDLVVSLGPLLVTVPDLAGLAESSATSALLAAGLAVGSVTSASSETIPAGQVVSQEPGAGASVPEGSSVTFVVSTGPAPVIVPDVFGLLQALAEAALTEARLTVGAVATASSDSIAAGHVSGQTPAPGTVVPPGSPIALVISLGPPGTSSPPDPATVATALDMSVATSLAPAVSFLYSGAAVIQTGVAPGTIKPERVAVLRGRVVDRNGDPLPGVTITVLGHAEYGRTVSRADGLFDLAVNGGGALTVNYEKAGLLPAQRQVTPAWRDYAWLPEVVLLPFDGAVTKVDLTADAPMQVARGSIVSDTDGIRQATLLVRRGTQAELVMPDGRTQPLDVLNVRMTEYTVGEAGPRAMPGLLPPTSGYTYAVELSADEAVASSARAVRFSEPLLHYVENFLGFPVGGIVPVGYYDRDRAAWVPSENGRVIRILDVTGGLANVDTDGDGAADEGLGITEAERAQIASLYAPGQSVWRVPILHFSPWDCNWPFGLPDGSSAPGGPGPGGGGGSGPGGGGGGSGGGGSGGGQCVGFCEDDEDDEDDDDGGECTTEGSLIACQSQVIGETAGVAGTRFRLHYSSDRVPGYRADYTIRIPLSAATVPDALRRIELEVLVAGVRFTESFPPAANQTATITWDGRDAYGRRVQGEQPVTVRVGYIYGAVYRTPAENDRAFAQYGDAIITSRSRSEIGLWQEWRIYVGGWDARAQGLGAWTINVTHAYAPWRKLLYLGDGTRRAASGITSLVMSTVAGNGTPAYSGDGGLAARARVGDVTGVAVGPDGSLYVADAGNARIRRVGPDGIITTVAGNGSPFMTGDGGPATAAGLSTSIRDVAVGPDGSLYIASGVVRRVGPDGIISRVAGAPGTWPPFSGDGGPATAAGVNALAIAVGGDGSLYIVDESRRIRRVALDGIINTVAGTGAFSDGGDDGPAAQASFMTPKSVGVGPDGSLYIADQTANRVRRVGPDGIITTVAGTGAYGFAGDGGPATEASLSRPSSVALGPDGSLYIADTWAFRVRRVAPSGIITTIGGNGEIPHSGEGGPATLASINFPFDVAIGPGGSVYVAADDYRVRALASPEPRLAGTDTLIPSVNGRSLYVFDGEGRHRRTLDASTGAVRYEFAREEAGRLTAIADRHGNVTTLEHDGAGAPAAIVASDGQRTTLAVDPNGYLSRIANPLDEAVQFAYGDDGLLGSLTTARGHRHQFTYDSLGRLGRDADPVGGSKTLARTDAGPAFTVTVTTALGVTTEYRVETLSDGGQRRVNVFPGGVATERVAGPDGTVTARFPDGMITTRSSGPDPRWGMLSPVDASETLTTPSGLRLVYQTERSVVLGDPNNPLSLTGATETIRINGRPYAITYESTSRSSTLTTPAGRQSSNTVDDRGRIVRSEVSGLHPTTYVYDGRGRVAAITTGAGPDARTATFTYGADGLPETATDPLGRQLRLEHDAAGRITGLTAPGDRLIAFAYDASGNTAGIVPPGRPAHLFTHDPLDRTARYDPPEAFAGADVTEYAYTVDREPARITGPDGQSAEVAYDALGRMTSITTPRGALVYAYEAATGRISTITAPGAIELAYAYDGPLLTGERWAGAVAGDVRRGYDSDLRVTSLRIDDGVPIAFEYDPDGLVTRAGGLALARHPQTGLVTGTVLGGVSDTRAYNGFGEGVTYTASFGAAALFSQQHMRDALGRITLSTETVDGTTAEYAYAYDVAGRLAEVTKDGSSVVRYTYDVNGNRLSAISSGGVVVARYDDQDRLIEHGTVTYLHAARGERVARIAGGQTTSYEYDLLGNLLSVVPPAGARIAYLVDGRNRRIGKTLDGVLVQGFLYQDRLRPVAELDGGGTVVARFVYGSGTHAPDYMVKGGATYRIVADHVGSPRLVVNVATGEIAQRMDYDAFGKVLLDTNPGFQPFGFAGGLYDRDTGLTRFGRRDYEAETGRWTARDPAGFRGGDTNLYAYAFGDPVNRTDVGGAQPRWLIEMMGGDREAARTAYEALEKNYRDTLKKPGGGRQPFDRANYNYWLREALQRIPELLTPFKLPITCIIVIWPFESLHEFFDYFQPFGADPFGPPPQG